MTRANPNIYGDFSDFVPAYFNRAHVDRAKIVGYCADAGSKVPRGTVELARPGMAYSKTVFRHLGNPSGLTGRLVMWRLNRVNAGMNALTYQSLALEKTDHVLEIGFGGAALLARILATRQVAHLAGTDISALAVRAARARFRRAVAAGVLELRECTDEKLPVEDGAFSKACCVNVIYFWPDVAAAVAEVYRVLSPGGRFVVCYAQGSPDGVTAFPPDVVEARLLEAGFATVETSHGSDRENGAYHCTVATKPAVA